MRNNAGMKLLMPHRWFSLGLILVGCGTSTSPPVVSPAVEEVPLASPLVSSPPGSPLPSVEVTSLQPPITQPHPATAPPQVVYRPIDDRPRHDDPSLAALGIHRRSSKHLVLYSDIESATAQALPGLVDQLVVALEAYFGPLPPAKDGRDFQMTGYLIRDLAVFRETGLVPEDLPTFEHGRHRGYEFWLRDQPFDYYRAHLLLHEATHCFMTILPDQVSPVWYLEGMAEFFGTHRLDDQGIATFGSFPQRPNAVPGWGRITLIQQAYAKDTAQTLAEIFALRPHEFGEPTPYAWTWAACEFLARHPRYRDRFRDLGRHHRGAEFSEVLEQRFAADQPILNKEWALFIHNLQYGYDVERAAIDFVEGQPLSDQPQTVIIAADRGWQSTAIRLAAGKTYRVSATGQALLASEPKPWVSEANGISIDYFGGQRLGQLLACIDPDAPSAEANMQRVFPLSRSQEFTVPFSGTLYLRINDGWDRLGDNTGAYQVTIQALSSDVPPP